MQHHVGVGCLLRIAICHSSCVGTGRFRRGAIGSLGGFGTGWRSFIDIAGVAILTSVIVISEGAFGQGVVVEIQRIRTAVIIALIFDAAPVADLSASWCRHAVAWVVGVNGLDWSTSQRLRETTDG